MSKIDISKTIEHMKKFKEPKPVKINELQLGNFIRLKKEFGGVIVKVLEILEEEIVWRTPKIKVTDNISKFETIPATAEFILNHTDFEEEFDNAPGIGKFTWLENDDTSLNCIIDGRYTFEGSNIYFSSIHEMQNLYKLSFKKELKINL